MDSQPSIESVCQAIHILHTSKDKTEKENASQWLQSFQKSVYAWKVSDEMLLHQNELGLEAHYFAAQTMKQKVSNSFTELPVEAYHSLKDSLIEHMKNLHEDTSNAIITQLALAIADLALQMSSWKQPVNYIIEKLSEKGHYIPLLEVLIVIPEEISSHILRLGKNRRHEFLQDLKLSSPTVTEFLKACMNNYSDSVTIKSKVFKCYSSWLHAHALELPDINHDIVIISAFQILANHQSPSCLHETAIDCICAILPILEDNNNFDETMLNLFTGILALEEQFHLSVAHEDQEKCLNYCKLFSELAESLLEKIVNQSTVKEPHFTIKCLDCVLSCVGHHDYEVASLTFTLWYHLSEFLYRKKDDNFTTLFKPYIERLIAALCKHCQMEPDHEGLVDQDHDFYDFRNTVSELVKDVVFIVGSSTCFRHMFHSLQQENVSWEQTEAALFIMQSVAKNVLPEENDVVPKVVEAILSLPPSTHIAVRHTSLLLIGELCEWIEQHPQTLETILNFLLYCLQQPDLASVSAQALQSICTGCRCHMVTHFSGLLQIVRSLDTFSISNDAALGLLKGVSVILSDMPHDQINQALKEICLVQVNPLVELMDRQEKIQKDKMTDPVLWLDRLSTIFKHTLPSTSSDQVHPCQSVISDLWPVLSRACETYQHDSRTTEHCCRCLRYAIRCVGKSFAPLLEPLVKQMVAVYSKHPHSCFLYLSSILVDEYASTSDCIPGLLELVKALLPPTFSILQVEGGLKNHPDTVDDLFRLCTRFLQRAPIAFLTSSFISSVMQCGILSTHLDHRDANSTVMKFFYDLVHNNRVLSEKDGQAKNNDDFTTKNRLMKEIIQKHGGELVNNLLSACVFDLHTYMMPDVADVIYELMQLDRRVCSQWLQEAIGQLPKNTPAGMNAATNEQLLQFNSQINGSYNSHDIAVALKELSRLYR